MKTIQVLKGRAAVSHKSTVTEWKGSDTGQITRVGFLKYKWNFWTSLACSTCHQPSEKNPSAIHLLKWMRQEHSSRS